MKRIDPYHLVIEKHGAMKVDVTIIAGAGIRLEEDSVKQLEAAASLPSVVRVVATPDIHLGFGVPIGCVAALSEYIVPAAVGYDINCGMRIVTTPFRTADVDVPKLAASLRRDIPLGEGKTNVKLVPKDLAAVLERGLPALKKIDLSHPRLGRAGHLAELDQDIARTEDGGSLAGLPSAVSPRAKDRGCSQLGTLGGGNHFIEIQRVQRLLDPVVAARFGLFENQLVVMVHSGSRGFGHQVCSDYIRKGDAVPSVGGTLRYLHVDSNDGRNYIGAMRAAANYAYANRHFLAALVRLNIRRTLGDVDLPIVYDVPHNIAKLEDGPLGKLWVHRKGATRAFPPDRMKNTPFADVGQPVLIPGSMGTASYVLVGTPEARDSLYSVNHGAGRVLSRSAARGKKGRPGAISDEDFDKSMEGVLLLAGNRYTVKEEAPAAYKDIDVVIDSVVSAGLARPVARMVPLAVLKG